MAQAWPGAPAKSRARFEALLEAGVDQQKQAIDRDVTDRLHERQQRGAIDERLAQLRFDVQERHPVGDAKRLKRRLLEAGAGRGDRRPALLQPLKSMRDKGVPAGRGRASAEG